MLTLSRRRTLETLRFRVISSTLDMRRRVSEIISQTGTTLERGFLDDHAPSWKSSPAFFSGYRLRFPQERSTFAPEELI